MKLLYRELLKTQFASLREGVAFVAIQNNQAVKKVGLLRLWLAMTILFFLLSLSAYAESTENNVKARLVSESPTLESTIWNKKTSSYDTGKMRLGVILNAPEGWHTYYKEPGDAGLPTKLTWQLPSGFYASEIDWPTPTKFSEEGLTTYGYSGVTLLPVTISIPDKLAVYSHSFTVTAEWLACNQICIPESQTLSIELKGGYASIWPNGELFRIHDKQNSQR